MIFMNRTEWDELLAKLNESPHLEKSEWNDLLLYAVEFGNFDKSTIEFLLFKAVKMNNFKAVEKFIKAGTDINAIHPKSVEALRQAVNDKNKRTIELLQCSTVLYWAVNNNKKEMVELLLKNGANIPLTNEYFIASLDRDENDIDRDENDIKEMIALKVLKKEVIFGDTSLWDLYREKDEKKLEYIVRREEVQNKLSEIDFTKKFTYEFGGIDLKMQFPNFGEQIGDNLKKGIRRAKAVDGASSVECWLDEKRRLNEHCLRKILEVADTESVNKIRFFKPTPTADNAEKTLIDPNANIRPTRSAGS